MVTMPITLNAGDEFPAGVTFKYVPYTEENDSVTACGIPINYDASAEFANQTVVLVSTPGAFTPTCQQTHLAGYLENRDRLKEKGVDKVIVIAYNDPFVMSAWGKANGVKDDFILFMSDLSATFSQSLGWTAGERTARYAIVVKNGKIIYAAKEPERGVSVSGVETVLAAL